MGEKREVVVLTGFLGAGKTSLLAQAVRDPLMARTAVIINEFGEVGLDHLLVGSSDENMVLMESGCICCTMRSDLAATLQELADRADAGTIPPFDRVVIETTGLADPVPILTTLAEDQMLAARFRAGLVIAVADGLNGLDTLARHEENLRQIAMADRLFLSKTDLAAPEAVTLLTAKLRAVNPYAEIISGPVTGSPAPLFAPMMTGGRPLLALGPACDHDHDHHDGLHHHHADRRIASLTLSFQGKPPIRSLFGFLEDLARTHGETMLRLKAIVQVQETPRPLALHGVQGRIYPPVQLKVQPDGEFVSQIVVILFDGDAVAIQDAFETWAQSEMPGAFVRRPQQ